MSLEQDIRAEIENIKKLKMAVGEINNHLSILEGFCQQDKQKWIDDAYEDGYRDGKNSIHKGCVGCKWESKKGDEEPCKHCSNAYRNEFTSMPKDEFCFGDEVVDGFWGKGIVVSRNNTDEMIWVLIKGRIVPQKVYKSGCRKTGAHRDLDSYFDEI